MTHRWDMKEGLLSIHTGVTININIHLKTKRKHLRFRIPCSRGIQSFCSGAQIFRVVSTGWRFSNYILNIFLIIPGPTILTYSSAEFIVIHAPSSVRFVPDADTLPVGEIPNIILSTFGSQLTEVINSLALGLS